MFEGSKTKKFIKIGASIMIGVGLGVLILAGLGRCKSSRFRAYEFERGEDSIG